MLNKLKTIQQQKSEQGFTIIEVMVVLAIAGLILVIVLLAVPAVQRNSRNTAIKNDVSTIAGGISTYESDNGGTPPTYINNGSGTVTIGVGSTDPNKETVSIQGGTAVNPITAAPTSTTKTPVGEVDYLLGVDCGNVGIGTPTKSARAISLYYVIETSSGSNEECLTS